jgi:hypothetical protein
VEEQTKMPLQTYFLQRNFFDLIIEFLLNLALGKIQINSQIYKFLYIFICY